MEAQQYRYINLKLSNSQYQLTLKIHNNVADKAKMTTLLYAKDFIKEKIKTDEVSFHFDDQNPTNEEEILQEGIDEVLVKTQGDKSIPEDLTELRETIYVNDKNQLVKITQVERNGRDTELHQILSFDVNKLQQADQHSFGLFPNSKDQVSDKIMTPLPRVKVPVKDGMSQSNFIQKNKAKQQLVSNPNSVFYTAEEVAKHNKENDCWTIWNGRVFDVTEYARVHPGGRKIFLGKGKDCTELYNKYHPWVNAAYLIGKYQVGILKN